MARHLAFPELASRLGASHALQSHGGVRSHLVPRGLGPGPTTPRWPARGYAGSGSTSRLSAWPAISSRRWRSSTTDCPSSSAATIESQGTRPSPTPRPAGLRPGGRRAAPAGDHVPRARAARARRPRGPQARAAEWPEHPRGSGRTHCPVVLSRCGWTGRWGRRSSRPPPILSSNSGPRDLPEATPEATKGPRVARAESEGCPSRTVVGSRSRSPGRRVPRRLLGGAPSPVSVAGADRQAHSAIAHLAGGRPVEPGSRCTQAP